jgi:hypothetical protein
MKLARIVLFLPLALLLMSGASAAAQSTLPQSTNAPAVVNVAAASPIWSGERIDRAAIGSGPDRGRFASIAMGNGATNISYYDATSQELKLARYPSKGGICGPNNSWSCQTVDSDGDVGQYSSVATADPLTGHGPGIAYYDATHNGLKFAEYVCLPGPCALVVSTIRSSQTTPVGKYPSLKYDSTGSPHIAFQAIASNGTALLVYAHKVSSGGMCLDAATVTWQCDIIDYGPDLGSFISLDLNTFDQPRIAYYDANSGDLKYAFYLGTGTGNCAFGTWECMKVDSAGDVGRFVSMQVDHTWNHAHVAYYDATNGKLKYAYYAGGSGNCGDSYLGSTVWRCETIDTMGTGLTLAGVSVAVNAKGFPFIAYLDASADIGPTTLKLARPWYFAPGETLNCGPADDPAPHSWVCNTLDIGGSETNEADYVSIAFDSSGLAKIAYYESDSYYGTGYLKFLGQLAQLWLPLLKR